MTQGTRESTTPLMAELLSLLLSEARCREEHMKRQLVWPLMVLGLLMSSAGCRQQAKEPALAGLLESIKTKKFVDLTHAFEPGIPHWPGFPDEKRETIYGYDEGQGTMGKGFVAQRYTLVGQWGTHCDPPAHFAKGKRTIDEIDPKEMLLPLVVLDIHEQVAKNPDYTIRMDDVREWERRHGTIPQGAFVALRTDWSKRWPDAKGMRNEDEKGV